MTRVHVQAQGHGLFRSRCCQNEPETHLQVDVNGHHVTKSCLPLKVMCDPLYPLRLSHRMDFLEVGIESLCPACCSISPQKLLMEPSLHLFNKVLCSFLRMW